MNDSDTSGPWTLTAPDGRQWIGESPLRALKAEIDSRIPAHVKLRNLQNAMRADEAEFEERLEAAYLEFDERRNGIGKWKGMPMSSRDAFKAAVRALDADESQP